MYPGSHELAYLHPNRFTSSKSIYKKLGINDGDIFFILRFVNWSAHHDIGHKGLKIDDKIKLVESLCNYGKVFITAEGDIPKNLEKFKISISAENMHDALSSATMYIGESSTMAEEAAILGTPSIYISTSAHIFGIIEELRKAKLLSYFHPKDFPEILQKVKYLMSNINLIKENKTNLKNYLGNRIDVTAFMTWLILNYPESINTLKTNPDYPNKFI
jgi:predicted glycosyltransferase